MLIYYWVDEKNNPVVGFNKESYYNNSVMVESPKNFKIISENTKLILAFVELLIKLTLKNNKWIW